MFTLFWKSTFTMFTFVILFLNVAFAMNVVVIGGSGPIADSSQNYFGITTLIDFFQRGLRDDSFLGVLTSIINRLTSNARDNLFGVWDKFASMGGVYSLGTFFVAIGIFFRNIFALIEFAIYPIMMIVFYILSFVWIVIKFQLILFGYWYTPLPQFTYN